MRPEELFNQISNELTTTFPEVSAGKMMSAPGLKHRDKVFAFFFKDKMCFRVGPQFDLLSFGVLNTEPLSPFKTKPPLKGWYFADSSESNFWQELSKKALEFTQSL